jgi:flavin reductase (DIM6/NTAB) family NADH-FMN oxidoreductase RutF
MEIDLEKLEARHSHDLLTSSIIPRPIAWVSSINEKGQPNIAPFSFFTGVSWAPPIIAFSVVNRSDGSKKDTIVNIEKIPEFVINVVSVEQLSAMETTAKQIPYGKDESIIRGIHLIPSKKIKPYRIREAKISFECVLERIVRVNEGPDAGNLILGFVKLLHIDNHILKKERDVDFQTLDALGRLSGKYYCTTHSTIESEKH